MGKHMCIVCNGVESGETNPDHKTIIFVLSYLDSYLTSLAEVLEHLCPDHRRAVSIHTAQIEQAKGRPWLTWQCLLDASKTTKG
jgi:hypothetical protein